MLIFIDFDDVLFNTKAFKKELIEVFLKNGIGKKNFFASYYDYPIKTKRGLKKYDPWRQIKILKEKKKFNERKLKNDLVKLLGNLKRFLFPDLRIFLKKFKKKELVLISYGDTEFQKIKIESSKVSPYFLKIVIADEDKAELIKKFLIRQPAKKKEDIFLLEDFPLHINAVKRKLPEVRVIRIKRKEGRYSKLPSLKADFEAKDLKEAERIIGKYKINPNNKI